MEQTIHLLQSHNLKATKQRIHVLKILSRNTKPLCVHRLVEKTKNTMDTATIYRILRTLVDVGIVVEENRGDEKVYHRCEANHVHIICYTCKTVYDTAITHNLPKNHPAFAKLQNHVTMQGICKKCSVSKN